MSFTKIQITNYLKDFPKISPKSSDIEKEGYLKDIGLSIDKQGKPHLNCNVFSVFFLKHTDVIALENGSLSIYDQKNGVYVLNGKKLISRAIKYIINACGNYWVSYFETIALQSIALDVNKITNVINDGEYINLVNGLLRLDDFTLVKHTPKIFTSTQVKISYKNEETPVFDKYLHTVTCGDDDLKETILQMMGYCLTENTSAEKCFWLYSSGKSGKTVLCKLITMLMGSENVSSSSLSALNTQFGLSALIGAKANISTENSAAKFRTDLLKALCSGDEVTCEIKYEKPISVAFTTKLIFSFNILPITTDTSYGFQRRLIIIPFDKKLSDDEVDINILSKMAEELNGILYKCVEALKRLKANDFVFPYCKRCEDCLNEYMSSLNPTIRFFENYYELQPNSEVKRSDIYRKYEEYCKLNSYEILSIQHFWNLLKSYFDDMGYTFKTKRVNGYDYYLGIALKNNCLSHLNEIEN